MTIGRSAGNLVASLDRLDEQAANTALDRLFAAYTVETVLQEVILPYLHRLGDRWAAGEVSVAQEHFASNLLRGRLLGLAQGWGQGHGPGAVLACLPGEQHELGLLIFGVALSRRGWRITYLGADCTVAMVEEAAAHVEPELIVVVAAIPERIAAIADDLQRLGRHRTTAIAGAGASAAVCAQIGIKRLAGDPVTAAQGVAFHG